jgi:hypothetical protein
MLEDRAYPKISLKSPSNFEPHTKKAYSGPLEDQN